MTPSELRYAVSHRYPDFFSRQTMKFFGDTMKNYGVRSDVVNGHDVWELYRKLPVKNGLRKSAYFRKSDFKRITLIEV